MMANPDETGCVRLNVTEDADGAEASRAADMTQCSIVSEYNDTTSSCGRRQAARPRGSSSLRTGQFRHLPLGEPIAVAVNVDAYEEQQVAYAYQAYGEVCE